jgi:hypothetical protein
VLAAVQSENANIPAGFIDLGPRSFSLKTSGSYTSLDQVRDTVIASVDGRIVRIRDVAEVSWNTAAYSYTGPLQGQARGVRHREPEGRLQHPRGARARDRSGDNFRAQPAEARQTRGGVSISPRTSSTRLNRLYGDLRHRDRLGAAHAD